MIVHRNQVVSRRLHTSDRSRTRRDTLTVMLRRLLQRRRQPNPAAPASASLAEAAPEPPRLEASTTARRDGEDDASYLQRLAHLHLEPEIAARWLELLRPAIRLAAAQPATPTVARLGGDPLVPAGFTWPVWDGHGPLSYIGEIDLAALAATGLPLDIALPRNGRFLIFYFDGSYDDFDGIVGTWDSSSLAGQRLLHLTDEPSTCAPMTAPANVPVFSEHLYTARPMMTFPNWEHPALRAEFKDPAQDDRSFMDHPVNAGDFAHSLFEMHDDAPMHQIGGWAWPDQGPVENEVAGAVLDLGSDWTDPRRDEEAARWTLLVQIDSDNDMMWGDVGKLYWLARPADLDRADLSRVSFTWQCG